MIVFPWWCTGITDTGEEGTLFVSYLTTAPLLMLLMALETAPVISSDGGTGTTMASAAY